MPITYDSISTTTLGSAQGTISLTGIPGTFSDLRVIMYGATTNVSQTQVLISYNGNTSNFQPYLGLIYQSSASGSAVNNQSTIRTQSNPWNTGMSSMIMDLLNYTNPSSGSTCTLLQFNGNRATTDSPLEWVVGGYSTTGAINRIDFNLGSGNFTAGTRVSVYGILRA